MLSSNYSWSTEYILSRSLHEIEWRMVAINKRQAREVRLNALIAGRELKEPVKRITPQDQNKAMEYAERKYKERLSGNRR
jgi:hypothetical protein